MLKISNKLNTKKGSSSLETIIVSALVLTIAVYIMLSFNTNIKKSANETNENISENINYALNEADYGNINTPVTPGGDLDEFEKAPINDNNLELAIRSELGISSGSDLLVRDMLKLTSLTASGKDIETLSGLEYASNLTSLNVSNNKIKDISTLKSLTKLSTLNISKNEITDYSVLEGLQIKNLIK